MIVDDLFENVAGPEKCWPGYRKAGTKPGTGRNAGKRVNDCEKIGESAGELNIGDPVIITGDVEFQGKTGDVREIGRDGAFVVVDLYNYGPYSFHASDVSYNDYADEADDEDVAEESKPSKKEYLKKLDQNRKDIEDARKQGMYGAPGSLKNVKWIKKGVAEGGMMKSIKRGLKGWQGSSHLTDIQDYIRNASDKTLLFLYKNPGESPYKQTPRDIQIKLINRELKRRYGVKPGEQGVEESKYPWLDAEKPPKQPDAPKLVRDRKTGKEYDPHLEFAKAMNSPEVRAQMKRMAAKEDVTEADAEKIGGRYDPEEFDQMMLRLKTLAGAGPLKTVWDPVKRVYKNVPIDQNKDNS
jgi:hypothetical protein